MQSLLTLIDLLEKGTRLHINMLDLSGVLSTPATTLPFERRTHANEFCDVAKMTEKGYRACCRCKDFATKRCLREGKAYFGMCSYGMIELVYPVVLNGVTVAIIFIGNTIINKKESVERIKKTCSLTGSPADKMIKLLDNCETFNKDDLMHMAEIIADYLIILYERLPKNKTNLHWLVAQMKLYADERYCHDLYLADFADTYQMNVKYIGRLFKKEMGKSFIDYCNQLRIKKAEYLLEETNDKIIDIALSCGFDNISYFNRLFQKKHGISPSEYRVYCRTKG